MSHNNPYAKATGAYNTITSTTTDSRTLEAQALLHAAHLLETMANRLSGEEKVPLEDIDSALIHNRKLWQLFLDDMMNPEHLRPMEMKNNVASLAVYVFKRTQEILIDTTPDKFKVLIDINRNIASGLMKTPPKQATILEHATQPSGETMATATDSMA